MRASLLPFFALTCLFLCVLLPAHADEAEAGGANLNGREAPELVFSEGLNGVERGARLSQFRGRPVLLFFWLRDCPHCRRELPRIQRLFDAHAREGLQILTIVHGFSAAQVQAKMRQDRLAYDFPIVTDPDGSQARRYRIGRRPTYYLVGADGRVKSSNGASDDAIRQELARWRLAQVGELPEPLLKAGVRDAVWQDRLADALAAAEQAAAAAPGDGVVSAATGRVLALARQGLGSHIWQIERAIARGNRRQASSMVQGLSTQWQRTSLADEAREAGARLRARLG